MTAALNRAERRKAAKLQRKGRAASPYPPGTEMPLGQALNEAIRVHQAGDLTTAESVYMAILGSVPDQPDALTLYGVLRHQKGDTEHGISLLQRARELAPSNAEVHANLGAVLLQSDDAEGAEASLREALSLKPGHVGARLNLMRLLQAADRVGEAIDAGREGLRHDPGIAAFHKFLGELHLAAREFAPAKAALEAGLKLDPDDGGAWNDLAICAREMGDLAEAERCYRKAIEFSPDRLEIRHNYGALLLSQGRVEEANEHLDRVLGDNPDHWMTVTLMAVNLIRIGREEEAIAMMMRAAEAHPDDPIVWNDVGAQFMKIGKFEEALKMFQRSVELDPNRVEPQTNLANAYYKLNQGYDAIREYEKALKIEPRHLEAHVTLCRVLKEVYRLDEANIYAHATTILPNFGAKYFSNPLQVFRATCDYAGLKEMGNIFKICDYLAPTDVATAMLQLLVYGEDEAAVNRLSGYARNWAKEIEMQAAKTPLPERPRAPKDKVRVGILSSDLRKHSVSRFVLPICKNYDRSRFEIYCYPTVRNDADQIQAEYKGLVDKFTFVQNMTDREVALTIAGDDIDILFELNGFTSGGRPQAIAWKPAPVQISWLGYPFTSGFKEMDYVLVDEHVKWVGEAGMMEKPLVMPGSWICFGAGTFFDPVDIVPEPPMAQYGVVTFGTLNNTYKYTPAQIALWSEVLKAVPNSRFLIVRPECGSMITCKNLADEFAKNGIPAERLYFMNNRGQELSHLAYYNEIDITLDTFPVTGGTTTVEALWMGVPVVSLVGDAYFQRISYAILKQLDLDECCAFNKEDFVAKAVALADAGKLRALRRDLRPRLEASTLARPDLFVENFQTMLEDVARRHGLK